jgi:predicted MFS family arabinose efflux permease
VRRERLGPVLAFAVFGLFWGSWDALLPAIKQAAHADDGQLGLALLAAGVGALPLMLVVGPLSDRSGRPTVADALLAFAVVAVVPGFARSPAALSLALLGLGAASGALDVVVNARVAAVEQGGRRLMSFAHAMFSLGLLCGSVATGLARHAGADRRAILGVVAALVLAAAWVNRGARTVPSRPAGALRSLARPGLVVLGLLCALAFVIEGGVEQWSAIHLEDTLGASAAVGGLGPGVLAGAMVVGRVAGQARAHRFSATQLMVASGLVAAAGIGLAAAAPVAVAALAGFAITGLGVSLAAPTFFGLAARVAPDAPSTALSSVAAVSYLGFLASPPAVGAVASAAGLRIGLLVLVGSALALAGGMKLRARSGALPA